MTTRAAGADAERAAEKHLKRQGFRLLERNYATRMGEIDLIMSKRMLTVFIEVRLRTRSDFGSGADSVTKTKQRKLIKTAQHYLQQHPPDIDESFRFDVVSMSADGVIDWIPDAFNLDAND